MRHIAVLMIVIKIAIELKLILSEPDGVKPAAVSTA
jgi:hypothetical protein